MNVGSKYICSYVFLKTDVFTIELFDMLFYNNNYSKCALYNYICFPNEICGRVAI